MERVVEQAQVSAPVARLPREWARAVWKFARLKPLGALGAVLILIAVVAAIFPYVFATHDPARIVAVPFTEPGAEHLLGADYAGRDLWSRTVWGARLSIMVGVLAVFAAITVATFLAIVTAYYGGLVDLLFQRVVDTMMTIPGLVLALFVLVVLGSSLNTLIFTIAVIFVPPQLRTMRSAVLSIKEMPYVDSARAIGASTIRIFARYIFPQLIALYLILGSLIIGTAIIIETSLTFLGLGLPGDVPSWGNLVSRGVRDVFNAGYRLTIPPAIAIGAAVFGFNLLGDALRDVLDPRLRGSGVGLTGRAARFAEQIQSAERGRPS